MSRYRDAEDWYDWARAKYEAAQERFAFSASGDSSTMDSYSELMDVIDRGIRRRVGDGGRDLDREALSRLAEQMEWAGESGFGYNSADLARAAEIVRRAIGERA